MSIIVANFYKFTALEDPAAWGERLRQLATDWDLKGTFLLASEGLNASLAGTPEQFESFMNELRAYPEWRDVPVKSSWASEMPFRRLLVKIKPQILTFPVEHDPSVAAIRSTSDLTPTAWDELLATPKDDLVILDTRNDYEVAAGKFQGAEDLAIESFREFPARFLEQFGEARDKTYLMYCTGGIRCEKAAAFATAQGFKNVYKLEGGILAYMQQLGRGRWEGDCFVFDDREIVPPSAVGETR